MSARCFPKTHEDWGRPAAISSRPPILAFEKSKQTLAGPSDQLILGHSRPFAITNSMMDSLGTTRLLELAEQKHHLLTQLRELSIEQSQLAEQRSAEELLSLLSRKSDTIEILTRVQESLKPFQAQQPEERKWPSESERDRCRSLFVQSEKIIAEILVIDNQTLGEMSLQRDLIGQQLSQFTSAEAIHDAYSGIDGNNDVRNANPFFRWMAKLFKEILEICGQLSFKNPSFPP